MRARSLAPPDHYPMNHGEAIWERQWGGGIGSAGGDDDEGAGSDDDS